MTARAGSPRRFLRFRPIAVVAVVVVAYGLFWLEGANRMRRSIDDWAAAQRASGLDVSFDRVATTGFPFSWRGVVDGATIAEPSQLRWSAKTLYIEASPLAPNRLVFSVENSQTIDLGPYGRWRVDAAQGRASIVGGNAWALDVRSGKSLIEPVGGGGGIACERFGLIVAPSKDAPGRVEADLAIEGLTVEGLARPVEASVIEARLAIVIAPEGGPQSLEIRRFHVEAAGAKVELSGALSADALGYPTGSLKAEIANPGAIATLLGEIGALGPADAEQAAASLTLAAIASGGKITAPLILKDGYATIAGVAIAKLPRIVPETYAPRP